MTDKQIIFDDVDVKDCIAYAKSQTVYLGDTVYKQMEKVCMVKNQPCKFFDCQFKQMARELKAKEQECEELKEELKTKTYHWEQCTEEILKGTKQFVDRMEKAEKTLIEIKEIAEKRNYLDYNECLDDILQKISEVEDENS